MAERAIRGVRLDIGGVDFPDHRHHPELPARPAARSAKSMPAPACMHIAPPGRNRDVGGKVMEMLFPAGSPSRILIAALTRHQRQTTTARMLAHVLRWPAISSARPRPTQVYIDGNVTVKGDDRPGRRLDGAARPADRRHRGARDRARYRALRASVTASATWARCSTSPPTISASAASTRSTAGESASHRRGRARDCAVLNGSDEQTSDGRPDRGLNFICYVTAIPTARVFEHIRLGQARGLEQG